VPSEARSAPERAKSIANNTARAEKSWHAGCMVWACGKFTLDLGGGGNYNGRIN